MTGRNPALALALGAGGGLALWYLLRDKAQKAAPLAGAPTRTATPPAGLCTLRLAADGLTADGQPADVPSAVAMTGCMKNAPQAAMPAAPAHDARPVSR